jgi:hypothetical protein
MHATLGLEGSVSNAEIGLARRSMLGIFGGR